MSRRPRTKLRYLPLILSALALMQSLIANADPLHIYIFGILHIVCIIFAFWF